MPAKQKIPAKFKAWIQTRDNFRLSDAQIQMARELGLSPQNFGSYVPKKDEPWKVPLKQFIESQYQKRFGRSQPEVIQTMEEIAAAYVAGRLERKQKRQSESRVQEDLSLGEETS